MSKETRLLLATLTFGIIMILAYVYGPLIPAWVFEATLILWFGAIALNWLSKYIDRNKR